MKTINYYKKTLLELTKEIDKSFEKSSFFDLLRKRLAVIYEANTTYPQIDWLNKKVYSESDNITILKTIILPCPN